MSYILQSLGTQLAGGLKQLTISHHTPSKIVFYFFFEKK